MVHAYHLIMPMYGFWLPNDPRGSWSDFVRKWELVRFGKSTKSEDRRDINTLNKKELAQRDAAKKSLRYPHVSVSGNQALSIAKGFGAQVRLSGYSVWACSILPEHTHMIIGRHSYGIEKIANLLKGAATRQIVKDGIHPLETYAAADHKIPRMWSARQWKVFLENNDGISEAIDYVEENPVKENKPAQTWSFVEPFRGIPVGWTI